MVLFFNLRIVEIVNKMLVMLQDSKDSRTRQQHGSSGSVGAATFNPFTILSDSQSSQETESRKEFPLPESILFILNKV